MPVRHAVHLLYIYILIFLLHTTHDTVNGFTRWYTFSKWTTEQNSEKIISIDLLHVFNFMHSPYNLGHIPEYWNHIRGLNGRKFKRKSISDQTKSTVSLKWLILRKCTRKFCVLCSVHFERKNETEEKENRHQRVLTPWLCGGQYFECYTLHNSWTQFAYLQTNVPFVMASFLPFWYFKYKDSMKCK